MAVAAPSSAPYLRDLGCNYSFKSKFRHRRMFPSKKSLTIISMAPKKKVNKYDNNWKKQWFGAGIFYESSEEVEVDVFKKLEKRKVLSNVEKAGLLSKAEEFGLLSLLEKAASFSPSALASAALPALVAAVAAIVLIPDDSVGLVVAQAVVAAALGGGAVGLFVVSVVLDGLQEAD